MAQTFGEVAAFPVGSDFETRVQLARSGVHRQTQAGITGTQAVGAESIVLSGGYEDDEDLGDVIVYTGHGGRDSNSGKQVRDQTLTGGNLALVVSHAQGLPIRVIRGSTLDSPFAPDHGYRYDGLFKVSDYWSEKGKAGFLVCRYRLIALAPLERFLSEEEPPPTGPAPRSPTTIQRLVRDTKTSRKVKQTHRYICQVCGLRMETEGGPYAEGAHIRPLGRPHNGPDTADNILCLCANHHVLFDLHGFSISDDLELIGLKGKLRTNPRHQISKKHLAYRREHYARSKKR